MVKVSDFLDGVNDEENTKEGIRYAIDFIKERQQIDRLSHLGKEDMVFLLKLYTIAIMFSHSEDEKNKALNIIEKYLALRSSIMGFGMTKLVDMFKTDIEYNVPNEKIR